MVVSTIREDFDFPGRLKKLSILMIDDDDVRDSLQIFKKASFIFI
jgi:hypothetical protein